MCVHWVNKQWPVIEKKIAAITAYSRPHADVVENDFSIGWYWGNCLQHNLMWIKHYVEVLLFKRKKRRHKYAIAFHSTFVPGSVTTNWTNTCLQEFEGTSGDVQISLRPVLLLERARSWETSSGTGERYRNSRQASPSRPRAALSSRFTTTSPVSGKGSRENSTQQEDPIIVKSENLDDTFFI